MKPRRKPSGRLQHSLELQFGRVLIEAEWREVVEAARKLPYVVSLLAHARVTAAEDRA